MRTYGEDFTNLMLSQNAEDTLLALDHMRKSCVINENYDDYYGFRYDVDVLGLSFGDVSEWEVNAILEKIGKLLTLLID